MSVHEFLDWSSSTSFRVTKNCGLYQYSSRTKTIMYAQTVVYGGRNPRARIGNVFLIIGKLLHVIGMFTPYWLTTTLSHEGLWQLCFDTPFGSQCISILKADVEVCVFDVEIHLIARPDYFTRWFRVVQAMSCLGLIMAIAAVTFNVVYIRRQGRQMLMVAGICSICAGVLVLMGVAIFGGKSGSYLGWSFYLEAVGGCLLCIAGGLHLAGLKTDSGFLPN
ncbi:uncharacterized protein LOC121386140 [Gigantopelta aegis]|uniref:uncharacterized protein LOC121386140 n=1 Tax=Gigantopelta aegis TaxID=1735272 RepID=UPI001B889D7B|nr:uncharacterized protein LOC121386140 [Gigantopelta aegis]